MASPNITVSKKTHRLVMQENIAAYSFMAPFLLFFVGFVLYPMFMCLFTSLFDATMGREDIFVGLGNYKELFADPVFWVALRNTMVIVLVSVPVTCAFSLWVASAISKMHVTATSASAAFSTCPWSPVPWPSPWSGNGCSTTTTAS